MGDGDRERDGDGGVAEVRSGLGHDTVYVDVLCWWLGMHKHNYQTRNIGELLLNTQ